MVCLEICIDSFESAVKAIQGGAHRLEVCSALGEGGLTPSVGLIKRIRSFNKEICLMCLIRPRAGNFVYTNDEVEIMKDDIKVLKDSGADGFVIGALTDSGDVDMKACNELVSASGGSPLTFHRAFDFSKGNIIETVEQIKTLGCQRILTSGREANVEAGLENLKRICRASKEIDIIIMPGGGVRLDNVLMLKQELQISDVHMSASVETENIPGMGVRKVVDENLVKKVVNILKSG